VDLTGSGIHSFDTNGITSLSQYVKPLTDFLDKLVDGEKVLSGSLPLICFCYCVLLFALQLRLRNLHFQVTEKYKPDQ
jgi:hypothetical protein